MLSIGKKAPAFSLQDKNNKTVRLKDVDTTFTVLYFYPKDNTPGCTLEAIEFTALEKEFKKANASIIGISGGTNKSKTVFCQKHNLTIPLLSDTDFSVATKYDVYGEKKFMGRTYNGIFRTTFVLDKQKTILRIFENVKVKDHAKEVLTYLQSIK